jgi:guanyl-specific ribonuclease Sa
LNSTPGPGNRGAVRIVWPGNTRQFPSTCVGAP